jgi:hypothetical protein
LDNVRRLDLAGFRCVRLEGVFVEGMSCIIEGYEHAVNQNADGGRIGVERNSQVVGYRRF